MTTVPSLISARPVQGRGFRRGQTLVEYSLVLAVITVVMIAVMSLLGNRIVIVFSAVTALLDTAQGSH